MAGGGGAENRNAPNDTAALGFVENSEAERYVIVVVVIGDVMNLAVVVTTLLCWRSGVPLATGVRRRLRIRGWLGRRPSAVGLAWFTRHCRAAGDERPEGDGGRGRLVADGGATVLVCVIVPA